MLQNYARTQGIPIVNAVALILILVSIVPVYIAQRLAGAESATTRSLMTRSAWAPRSRGSGAAQANRGPKAPLGCRREAGTGTFQPMSSQPR